MSTFDSAFGIVDFASALAHAERDLARLHGIDRYRDTVNYDDVSNHCSRSIWHLIDWMFKESQTSGKPLPGGKYKSADKFGEYVRTNCDEMKACYQFATGSKHGEVRNDQGMSSTASAVFEPTAKQTSGMGEESTHAAVPVLFVRKIAMDGSNHIPLDVFERALVYMRNLAAANGFA